MTAPNLAGAIVRIESLMLDRVSIFERVERVYDDTTHSYVVSGGDPFYGPGIEPHEGRAMIGAVQTTPDGTIGGVDVARYPTTGMVPLNAPAIHEGAALLVESVREDGDQTMVGRWWRVQGIHSPTFAVARTLYLVRHEFTEAGEVWPQ